LQWENTNDIQLILYNGSGPTTARYTDGITDTKWHHVMGVYNGTNVLVYVDGIMGGTVGTLTGNTASSAMSMFVGSESGSLYFWNGTIDDVMIFNRSLSAAEISNIYNNQSANYNGYNGIPYYTDYQNLTTTGVLKVFTISTEANFVFPDYLFLVGTNNFYSPIIKSNISIDAWYEAPVSGGDTCTYGGSGNWAVTCSDYCNITTNVNGGNIGNNFTAIGVGWFKMSANISGFKNYKFAGGCNATCLSGGCIRI
jgi:hypothetical protein